MASENAPELPPSSGSQNYAFYAVVDDIKDVSTVLNAIHFRDAAIIIITEQGMKVTVEDGKCIQESAFIPTDAFQEFRHQDPFLAIQVNFNALLDCLNIYGNSSPQSVTSLRMSYLELGSPLVLLIEDNGAISECRLKTFEPKDMLEFDLSPDSQVNKIIMKSKILKQTWHDLDMTRDVLMILMSPKTPHLQFTSKSRIGTTIISFPRDSADMVVFQCTQTQENSYQMSLLRPSFKALHVSSDMAFRTNERGMLCLQYLIKTPSGRVCFIDFMCAPDVPDEGSL